MNVDSLLQFYSPGLPKMKPDVLEQMVKIEETKKETCGKYDGSGSRRWTNNDPTRGSKYTIK